MIESISSWFHGILSSAVWSSLAGSFGGVDIFTGLFIVVGFVYGAKQGLMREIGETVEVLIVLYVTVHLHVSAVEFMKTLSKQLPLDWSRAISYFVIMAVVWLIILIVDSYGRRMMHTQIVAPIRVLGGAAIGVGHALLIMSVVCFGLSMVPVREVKSQFDSGRSITGAKIIKIAPAIHEFTVQKFVELQRKAGEMINGAKG